MKDFLLTKVRLSYYYPIFFGVFLLITLFAGKIQLVGVQLTLFSVNSFLLAFYLSPVLTGQKARIEELNKVIRNESITFFNILVQAQELPDKTKHEIRGMSERYIKACLRTRNVAEGEKEYEKLISYCIDYKGKDKEKPIIKKILDTLVTNQQNRSQLSMLLRSGVYSHEWLVMFVLFAITVSYILVADYGGIFLLNIFAALLATGLVLLLIILQKLSTLTHKKALHIWDPFDKLLKTDFRHID